MHERGDPLADVGGDLRGVPARETEVREHRVRRGGDVGGGVEERAVQVEEDGAELRGAHAADASAARIATIVAL